MRLMHLTLALPSDTPTVEFDLHAAAYFGVSPRTIRRWRLRGLPRRGTAHRVIEGLAQQPRHRAAAS